MNDASSLIVFRFAIIAVSTGQFVFRDAAFNFVMVIVMGILIGVVIGYLYFKLQKWLPTTVNMDTVLTITAPYVMYITAESFHFSGVLAVVSGGLFLSSRSHIFLSFRSRIQGANVWSTLTFALNGIVFMLIGLQLPVIVNQLGSVKLSQAIWYGVVITAVLIVSRILCTMGAAAFTRFISRYIKTADSNPGWRMPLAFGWAGMRGVVSLAAALSIPIQLADKSAFPQRNLILFITFVVILLTLVIQGLTLPWVIKWLKLGEDANSSSAKEQERLLRKELAEKCIRVLNETYSPQLQYNKSLHQLKTRFETDQLLYDGDNAAEEKEFRKIYIHLLQCQRDLLHERNKELDTDEDLIRKYLELLDLEEAKLRARYEP
jgi:Na+/H+ antiporter